jgi:hypothetical protein
VHAPFIEAKAGELGRKKNVVRSRERCWIVEIGADFGNCEEETKNVD